MFKKSGISYVPEGSLRFRWKLLVVFLLLMVIAEGWLLHVAWDIDSKVIPQNFSFFDDPKVNGFISAQGIWTSDTKQPFSWQAATIHCYRDWGYCIEALAIFNNGALLVYNNNYKVTSWNKDEIEAVEENVCAQTIIRFDRIAKAVTATRSSLDKGSCGPRGPSVLFHLVDGLKVKGIGD